MFFFSELELPWFTTIDRYSHAGYGGIKKGAPEIQAPSGCKQEALSSLMGCNVWSMVYIANLERNEIPTKLFDYVKGP